MVIGTEWGRVRSLRGTGGAAIKEVLRSLKEPLMFHGIIGNDSVTPAQLAHWVERQIELKGGASLVLAFTY